jgi:serine protease Do
MDALDGVEVMDLTASARRRFELPRSVHTGAVVTGVQEGSSAAEAGLREGDVILELNRQPIKSADDAVALSEKVKGERVLLRVWSQTGGGPGGTHYVVVESPKRK